jgi:hypothetical protein
VSFGVAESNPKNAPLRGTQLLVEHMGTVFRRPGLIAIEVSWRWLFGIPFLLICFQQAQQILAAFPLDSSGFSSIDAQNPWLAATQISGLISYYQPHVWPVLGWLLPAAAGGWIVISGLGRGLLLSRLQLNSGSHLPFRPVSIVLLQAVWLGLFAVIFWCWFRSMQWDSATHIAIAGEPDLIGYFIWAIFLSLGFFALWALVSWTVSVAPLLALLEDRSAFSALGQTPKLGRAFAGKLAEINLVLGIVKLALLVLAMVFSAAPLPFSDELGPAAMHVVWAASAILFLAGNDYFQVVRLKAFLEFWKAYRGAQVG